MQRAAQRALHARACVPVPLQQDCALKRCRLRPRAQVDALDRVLTRLALTEDAALEAVLAKLLPRVIDQLKTPHATVRQARTRQHPNWMLRAPRTRACCLGWPRLLLRAAR